MPYLHLFGKGVSCRSAEVVSRSEKEMTAFFERPYCTFCQKYDDHWGVDCPKQAPPPKPKPLVSRHCSTCTCTVEKPKFDVQHNQVQTNDTNPVGRPRVHSSDAAKSKAWRDRKKEKATKKKREKT
jgi:hypothetical protein